MAFTCLAASFIPTCFNAACGALSGIKLLKRGFFSYENLGGDYLSLENDIRLGVPTAVFGVQEPHKYLTASLNCGNFVYITADSVSARRAAESISALSGEQAVLLTAKDDVLLYKEAVSRDTLFSRLTAAERIYSGARIVVCDIEAAMQLFPAKQPSLMFSCGDECDYSSLPSVLVSMGYTREYEVEAKG